MSSPEPTRASPQPPAPLAPRASSPPGPLASGKIRPAHLQRNAIVIDRFFESREAALAWERLHPHFMTVRVVQPESREKLEISKPEMPTSETHTAALPKTSKLESPVNADGTEFAGPIDPLMRLARRSAL